MAVANLSIRTRIILAFAVMLAVVGGLGALSLQRAAATNDIVATLVTDYFESLGFLDDMRFEAAMTRSLLNKGVWLSSDKAELQAVDAKLGEAAAAFHTSDAKYLPTISSPAEAKLHDRITAAAGVLFSPATAVRALLQAGKMDETKSLMVTAIGPAAGALDSVLMDDYKLNSVGAGTQAAQAAANDGTGRIYVIGLLIASCLIAIVCGAMLVASIARPIAEMTMSMGRLAARDFSIAVPFLARGDEIGRMAQALQSFKQGLIDADRLLGQQETAKVQVIEVHKAALSRIANGFEAQVATMMQVLTNGAAGLTTAAQSVAGGAERAGGQPARPTSCRPKSAASSP